MMLLVLAMNVMQKDQVTASNFLAPEANISVLSGELQFTEGPCILDDESLVFSDISGNRMYRIVGAKTEIFRDPSRNANGNTLDPQGRLVTCEHGARRVVRQEKDGTITVLAEKFNGKRLNSPNDVVVRKDGVVFFTDPPYGIDPGQAELDFNGVYALVNGSLNLLDKTFDRPNGLALSLDQKTLYIADTAKSHIRRFSMAKDGALSKGKIWAETPNPDGIRVDRKGRIWSASGDGVNVISPEGKVLQVIPFPQQPANLCFSKDGKELFVTARTAVYRVRIKA